MGGLTRVLVLGGSGMLGHQMWRECNQRFECFATVRREQLGGAEAHVLDPSRTITGVAADDPESIGRALDRSGAQAVVNCIGVVKQADEAADATTAIRVNALLPHELAGVCRERGARLVQISTDCVFAGLRGAYSEDDIPDARDLYGRSKLLGEVTEDGCVTLRTSIVGRELASTLGLVEWLISNRGGAVRGFTRAVFSGMTTRALAREVAAILEDTTLTGLWHVGGDPISKHDLLMLIRDALGLEVEIVPDDSVVVDRSLDCRRYRRAVDRKPPSWREMIDELGSDPTPYDLIRSETVASR